MDTGKKSDTKSTNQPDEQLITENDVISIINLSKTSIKDRKYAFKNITIARENNKSAFEVSVKDIDGHVHQFYLELKIYP